jgi:transposase
MAAWNQKRRDPLTLEEKRESAIQLLVKEEYSEEESSARFKEADVARKFGVTRRCVTSWVNAYRKAGNSPECLNAKKHTGRSPQITEKQKAKLVEMIPKGALYYGFETDIWNLLMFSLAGKSNDNRTIMTENTVIQTPHEIYEIEFNIDSFF